MLLLAWVGAFEAAGHLPSSLSVEMLRFVCTNIAVKYLQVWL
jgi:hypothetical protein